MKKKSVSPHASLRSQPVKFSRSTRNLTVPASAILCTNSDCTASSSDFFSSPPTRRTRRRSGSCSRLALIDLSGFEVYERNSLGCGHEKHSDNRQGEHRQAEGRGEEPHAWLLKLPRRAGEEEHGRKENGVGEISPGAIARLARLGEP